MRTLISTPTKLNITTSIGPSWLPSYGTWGQVALNTASDVKGDFPSSAGWFPGSRDLNQLFNNYSGAVWNPYYGTYGAWFFHGGGHATVQSRAENSVYAWETDTRKWVRLSDPTYPGEVPLSEWQASKEPPYNSDLLNTYGELATAVPASTHSRWHPCIIPPTLGGGPKGSLLVAYKSSIHTGGNGQARQSHAFECSAKQWRRVGAPSPNPTAERAWSSCLDTRRGVIYKPGEQRMWRMALSTGTWSALSVGGYSVNLSPCVYVDRHDVVVFINEGTRGISVMDASNASQIVSASTTGTPPPSQISQSLGLTWCPDLGPYGAICVFDYTSKVAYACALPANPLAGTWTWSTLAQINAPSVGQSEWLYNRFQYAPSLKSFFLCGAATDGMWCFRPGELA